VERQNILENVGSDCNVAVIPNIHTILRDGPDLSARRHICFLGSCRINHNEDAVRWFLDAVFPRILQEAPDVEFHVMGYGSEGHADEIEGHRNARMIGYVEDAEAALARYPLFVCPMTYGAGMKGKMGVAAGAGTPIVTTSVGAEGFAFVNGANCFVADDPEEFAACCLRLLRDDAVWQQFSTQAQEMVWDKLGVEAVGRDIDALLRTVMGRGSAAHVPQLRTQQRGPGHVRGAAQTIEPKVSVVTACHNCEDYLRECLDSVRGQTMAEWELLLVDDGSTDGTRKIIDECHRLDPRIKPWYHDVNEGPYVRRRQAIAQASADFIVIQDSDDLMSPCKLELLYNEISAEPQHAVVGSFYRTFIDEFKGLEYTETINLPTEPGEIVEACAAWRHGFSHGSAIIRKELFERIGEYDGNPFASDAFWSAKLGEYIRQGAPLTIKNIAEYTTLIRIHATNQTQQLPTFDPRSRRTRYHQYCECKLRRIREKVQAIPGTDVAEELRQCDCSDFLIGFKRHILEWENQPLEEHVIPVLLQNSVFFFDHLCYVSCVSYLSGIEVMQPDIPQRVVNFDLLKAMALYALDLKERSLNHVSREFEHHNSPIATRFQHDCFECGLEPDVHRWCAEHIGQLNLQIEDASERPSALTRLSAIAPQNSYR
jgi:hypothetical protein